MTFSASSRFLTFAAAVLVLGVAGSAQSQFDNRNTMIMADGENRYVLHFTMPDIDLVVKPDLARSDVRIFRSELHLSDAQREAVERWIEEYLEAFNTLLEEKHPDPPAGEEDEPAGGRRATVGPPPGSGMDASPVEAIILDELNKAGFDFKSFDDLPVRPSVRIGASMTRSMGEDGELGPPEPSLDVSISLGGEDDALTDEMRSQLQAALDNAVPRVADHVRGQMNEQMAQRSEEAARSPADEIQKRWEEIQQLRARIKAFLREKHALRIRVMNEVQTILADEQIELWPAFERTFTRVKTLPLGVFDGESTDLIAVLDGLDLPDSQVQRLTDIPLAYETQLHTALTARNKLLEDIEAEIDMALFEHDGQKARSLTGRVTRARVAVRDVNERFTELIASQLETPAAESFHRAALAESCPRVYRPTLGEQAFDRALKLEGLNDDLRAAIRALEKEYRLQLNQINDRIASTIRRQQPRAPRESIDRAIAILDEDEPMGVRDPSEARDTITDDFRTRQNLDARTMRTLYGMLRPEQVAALPKIPQIDIAEPITAEHSEGGSEEDDF